jgi:hypothetical protein
MSNYGQHLTILNQAGQRGQSFREVLLPRAMFVSCARFGQYRSSFFSHWSVILRLVVTCLSSVLLQFLYLTVTLTYLHIVEVTLVECSEKD